MIEQKFNLEHNPCYLELINSEKRYLENFLYYLEEKDINALLIEFDNQKRKIPEYDNKQERLRIIYNHLKNLREAQRSVLPAFNDPSPKIWLDAISGLYAEYENYFKVSRYFLIPKEIDEKFKEMQARKSLQGYPSPGSLGAILIAPIQRLPRYILLAKELNKQLSLKANSGPHSLFVENLAIFIEGMSVLNLKLNHFLLMLDENSSNEPFDQLQLEQPFPV